VNVATLFPINLLLIEYWILLNDYYELMNIFLLNKYWILEYFLLFLEDNFLLCLAEK